MHSSRIGVELGYALVTCTFYQHNERIGAAKENRSTKPIFAKSSTKSFESEKFGLATPRMIIKKSTQLKKSASFEEKVSLRECKYDSIFGKFMHIFKNSEEYHSQEDGIDESVSSKQEGISLLLQAITHFYISQHLSTVSKTGTIDSCIFFNKLFEPGLAIL